MVLLDALNVSCPYACMDWILDDSLIVLINFGPNLGLCTLQRQMMITFFLPRCPLCRSSYLQCVELKDKVCDSLAFNVTLSESSF